MGFPYFLTEVNSRTSESYSERPREGRLRIACIGTQVVAVVAPQHTERPCPVQPHKPSRCRNQEAGQPRRDKVQEIVHPSGESAEVKISLGPVSDHRVQSVDRLVSHS